MSVELQQFANDRNTSRTQSFSEPESSEVSGHSLREQYSKESERKRNERKSIILRERKVREMEQTGEILEAEHPMYTIFYDAAHKMRPGTQPQIILSLNEYANAFAFPDKKLVVITAGLIRELNEFLSKKGRKLTQDHLAAVVAHEMSHWDEESEKPHIGETYCDTNGLMMNNTVKGRSFNIDCTIETFEFLEHLDEKRRLEKEEREGTRENEEESEGGFDPGKLTHPTSEKRRILVQLISQDPDLYLEGRFTKETPIDEALLADFIKRSDLWLERVQKRQLISSEQSVKEEFAASQNASQVLETFLSTDELYHTRMSMEFAKTPQFGNLLLAAALYYEMVGREFGILTKDDFKIQYRAGFTEETTQSVARTRQTNKKNFLQSAPQLSPDQRSLVEKCLNGEFADPLALLSAGTADLQSNYPELAEYKFNQFFHGLVKSINDFIAPTIHIKRMSPNLDRSSMFGIKGLLDEKDFIVEEGEITAPVSQKRKELMSHLGVALSSSLLEISQMYELKGYYTQPLEPFEQILKEAVKPIRPYLPDYSHLHGLMVENLLRSGSCRTREVATRLSLLILNCGRYTPDNRYSYILDDDPSKKKTLKAKWPKPGRFWVDTEETHNDYLENFLRINLALTQGGMKIGQTFGSPRVSSIMYDLESNFYSLINNQDALADDILDPYSVVLGSDPSIEVPYQDSLIDRQSHGKAGGSGSANFAGCLFNKDHGRDWRSDSFMCDISDEEAIRSLILESAPSTGGWSDRRWDIIRAVMSNPEVKQNEDLLRRILKEGTEKRLLLPFELKEILDRSI